MSYFRPGMGQEGPITDPSQVDSTIVGEVSPTRVECASLPADSPWRQPGQVCGPTLLDRLRDWLREGPTTAASSTATTAASDGGSVLLLGGLALAGYYLLRKKRR